MSSNLQLCGYWQGYNVESIDPYPLNEIPETVKYISIAFVKPVYKPPSRSSPNSKVITINRSSPNTNLILSHNHFKQLKYFLLSTTPLANDWSFDNEKDPDPFIYTTQQIKQMVQDINNRGTGQQVLLSLNDTSYCHWYPDVDIEVFSKNVAKSVHEWNLGGVDIDAESGMDPSKYVETYVQLIKCLRKDMGANKIISYTCYTESDFDTQILSQCKTDIDFLNTMAYWNGTDQQISLFKHYASCIGDPSKVGIGCKAGKDGDYTDINTVKECAQWCKQNGYKRMMLWALTRDVHGMTNLDDGTYLQTMVDNMKDPPNTNTPNGYNINDIDIDLYTNSIAKYNKMGSSNCKMF